MIIINMNTIDIIAIVFIFLLCFIQIIRVYRHNQLIITQNNNIPVSLPNNQLQLPQ